MHSISKVDVVDESDFDKVSSSTCIDTKSVVTDGAVLQKLLRRWRYFDSQGHAFNSSGQNRKKPCYVCGDVKHVGKKCRKRRTCYMCNGKGHIAEDCPKSDKKYDICLKCGDVGHDLISCDKDYSDDDLKKIQCYVCNEVGHLCCGGYVEVNPEAVSCYNCGESGHSGLECPKPRLDKCGSHPPSICYKCGEQGHTGRNCINNNAGFSFNNPKIAGSNGSTSELVQEICEMLDFETEPNDDVESRSRRMARKRKAYKYNRVKKQKKELIDSMSG